MKEKHILIIGSGSVGKRHAENLHTLGVQVSCFDPRDDRLEEMKKAVPVVNAHRDFDAALQCVDYDGVVIASPPVFHVEQAAVALKKNIPVLLEKPISPDLKSARELQNVLSDTKVPLLLGYTWRWWEPIRQAKSLLEKNEIGKLLHVQFVMSAHLEDWHPWEGLDFFMAHKEMGGGALLDESHWIDQMIWFFGIPEQVFGRVEKLSSLEIDSDDNVDAFCLYDSGMRVQLHLDLYTRPHEKRITFVGENGTLIWTADPNKISIGKSWEPRWEQTEYNCVRNDMFMEVAQEFVDVIDGKEPSCRIDDGIGVLRTIEAIRLSQAEGRMIALSEV